MSERNPFTVDELKGRMAYHLKYIKKNAKTKIAFDIPLNKIISTGSVGAISYAEVFEGNIRIELEAHGNKIREWPEGWLNETVNDLSTFLITGK